MRARRSTPTPFVICLVTAILLMLASSTSAIIFVDTSAAGGNNGTTWPDAYTNLVDALAANSTATLWVATGTYSPGPGAGDFFDLQDNDVYGGFTNGMTFGQRDPGTHVTTLDGGGAVKSVVKKSDGGVAVLEGFTIRDGNGKVAGDDGGGLNVTAGNISVIQCTFVGNVTANSGGAVYLDGATVIALFTNCAFNSNSNAVGAFSGGAIAADFDIDGLGIRDCTFDGNLSRRYGGDIFVGVADENITIVDCTFTNSRAVARAGAIYIQATRTNTLENLSFNDVEQTGSASTFGCGAVWLGSTLTTAVHVVRNCTFRNVSAAHSFQGGALFIDDGAVTIDDCVFEDLSHTDAGTHGGAIRINGAGAGVGAVLITNCIFDTVDTGPSGGSGGAIYIALRPDDVSITDCVFTNTTAGKIGGAIYCAATAKNTVRDCTFNDTDQTGTASTDGCGAVWLGSTVATAEHTVRNCTFVNVTPAHSFQGGALFVDDGAVTIDGCEFRNVLPSGNATHGGAIRINGGAAGAVVITNCTFNNVNTGGTLGSGGAIYQLSAFKTDPVTIVDCAFTNVSCGGIGGAIYIAAIGTNTLRDLSFENIRQTGSASTDGCAVFLFSASAATEYTVQNCSFVDVAITHSHKGGALYFDDGTVTVRDCSFRDVACSHGYTDGGAIRIDGTATGPILITNCTFSAVNSGSAAASQGGAIYLAGKPDDMRVVDCTFTDTVSGGHGGAIFTTVVATDQLRIIDRCAFLACATADTDSDGGAVYLADASAGSRIVNSIFARNSATRDGGAVHLLSTGSSLDIMHCTFYTNSAGRDGGALHSQGGVSLSITNTIIYENEAGLNGPELEIFGTCEIDYSNIDQSRTVGLDVIGANMFNTDPLFIDAANDDFGLMPLSPLIDAGLTLDNVKMDIAGTRRPRGKTSDIGARESPNDPSALMLRIL